MSIALAVLGVAIPARPSLAGLVEVVLPRPRFRVGRGSPSAASLESIGRSRLARAAAGSDRLERRLALAGGPLTADAWRGVGVVVGAFAAMVGLAGMAITPIALLLAPLGFVAGTQAPALVLARRAQARQDRIRRAVPGMVEVLVAATQAGLGPAMAFRRTAEVLGGPIGQELRLTAQEMDLGVPWETALHRLAARTDIESLQRLVAALARSNRLGTSVAASLRRVAEDLRRERRARAEEMARKAPIKMLFPLVFLILPAFLLLTVGPVLLATIRSLS